MAASVFKSGLSRIGRIAALSWSRSVRNTSAVTTTPCLGAHAIVDAKLAQAVSPRLSKGGDGAARRHSGSGRRKTPVFQRCHVSARSYLRARVRDRA